MNGQLVADQPLDALVTVPLSDMAESTEVSRWRTPEMRLHLAVVAVALSAMLWTGIRMSLPSTPHFASYERFLSKGWLGPWLDNSDAQFRGFRNNVPYLLAAMSVHLLTPRLLLLGRRSNNHPVGSAFAIYNLAFSLVFLTVLHGSSILKILIQVSLNYLIAKQFASSKWNPILTWTLALASLWWNERGGAQPFGSLLPPLAFLDNFRGLLPRWFVTFNLTNLRMISYNLDYYWSFNAGHESFAAHSRKCEACSSGKSSRCCDRGRTEQPLDPSEYSFLNYLSYTLYAPLFLAGPIITFNDYTLQSRHPLPSTSLPLVLRYALRWALDFLIMELLLHNIHAVALIRSSAWPALSPAEIGMVGYFNLKYIWLKLLVIWRFFRLWSLCSGIDPPENMHRCMSNNFSAAGFWRSWHRSYNRWLVRYLYLPLGGGGGGAWNKALAMPVVFTFVGFWHDRSFTLLAWAWLIILFLLPEGIATAYFGRKEWTEWRYYRYLAGVGGVLNILMMMGANLVGFAVGVDGVKRMVEGVFTLNGGRFRGGWLRVDRLLTRVNRSFARFVCWCCPRNTIHSRDDVCGDHLCCAVFGGSDNV